MHLIFRIIRKIWRMPGKLIFFLREFFLYLKDLIEISSQVNNSEDFKFGGLYPVLGEKTEQSGKMNGHYFHQDLLVAQRIFQNNPRKHFDIGSRQESFVAHVATFREIVVFDIRPQISKVKNIKFIQLDIMNPSKKFINQCDSLSSLHAVEHFGLGRYGDPLDINGHLKGILNMSAMLKSKGKFYFSVPIGTQRIEFNAHRVFSVNYLLDIFQTEFHIDMFSYVDDHGELHKDVTLTKQKIINNFGCSYGCGIFELTKK